jgi:hypothetical protein
MIQDDRGTRTVKGASNLGTNALGGTGDKSDTLIKINGNRHDGKKLFMSKIDRLVHTIRHLPENHLKAASLCALFLHLF